MTFSALVASVLLVILQTSKASIEWFLLSTMPNQPIRGAQVTAVKIPDPPAGNTSGATGGMIFTETRSAGAGPSDRPTASTDADGHFVFRDIDAGRYIVSA